MQNNCVIEIVGLLHWNKRKNFSVLFFAPGILTALNDNGYIDSGTHTMDEEKHPTHPREIHLHVL